MKLRRLALLGIASLAIGAAAHAGSTPKSDEQAEKVLTAMNNASTWGHPDLFGEFAGMRHFSEGDYAGAMKYFRIGARYADKLSQLSIGLMYENGNGVAKDPVTACAWLAMAAERKYPSFMATRDHVCKALTPAQHDQAVAVLEKLMPEYGDAAAKPRMITALHEAMSEFTGSRLGFDSGVDTAGAGLLDYFQGGTVPSSCGGPTLAIGGMAVPHAGCGAMNYYDPGRFEPKEYFAARDAQWRGAVSVGNMEEVHTAAQANAKPNTPAPSASSGSPTHR